jgi:hypothetical protein
MHIALGSAAAIAVAGTIAGVAGGGHHRCPPRRTVTIVRTVSSTTAAPPVAAFISGNGDQGGPDVQRPSNLWIVHSYLSNEKLLNLHWVDWGEPTAYSSATILMEVDAGPHAGSYDAVTGGVIFGGLKQCGNGRWYYSTAVGTSTGVQLDAYDSHPTAFAGGQLATPC